MNGSSTHRLFHDDATCLRFEAQVLDVRADGREVTLDRTAFYPTSGGQPHDTGTLAGIAVIDVTEDGDRIVHHLAEALPGATADGDATRGQSVHGIVDATRRFDLTQQHSGQHLLSAVLEDRFGWPTVSIHIGVEHCTLDLATSSTTREALRDAERIVNAHIMENRAVTIGLEPAETARNLRKPSARSGDLRIVTIDGLDRNACGGTHVTRTGEIGVILLGQTERVRDTTRVQFRCGEHALRRARRDAELLQEMAMALSASTGDLPALVAAQRDALRAAEKERARLADQLAAHEARALYESTAPNARGQRLHVEHLTDAPVKSRQVFAQQYAAGPHAVYLVVSTSPAALLLSAGSEAGVDCAAVLREALQQVGGRGGGTPVLAQGSTPSPETATQASVLVRRALGVE